MSNTLFELPPFDKKKTCRYCEHRQRWKRRSKVVQYCGITSSNRTNNELKKIKVTMTCSKFKPEDKNK